MCCYGTRGQVMAGTKSSMHIAGVATDSGNYQHLYPLTCRVLAGEAVFPRQPQCSLTLTSPARKRETPLSKISLTLI